MLLGTWPHPTGKANPEDPVLPARLPWGTEKWPRAAATRLTLEAPGARVPPPLSCRGTALSGRGGGNCPPQAGDPCCEWNPEARTRQGPRWAPEFPPPLGRSPSVKGVDKGPLSGCSAGPSAVAPLGLSCWATGPGEAAAREVRGSLGVSPPPAYQMAGPVTLEPHPLTGNNLPPSI